MGLGQGREDVVTGFNSEPAILVEGLTKSFGEVRALRGIDLSVPPGTVLGVLGPNGAGKTTAVRILTTLLRPDGGRALVEGHDVVRDWSAIKPLFGYVPDRENHFDEFTGRKNLEFFAKLYSAPVSRVAECLERVELSDAADVRAFLAHKLER